GPGEPATTHLRRRSPAVVARQGHVPLDRHDLSRRASSVITKETCFTICPGQSVVKGAFRAIRTPGGGRGVQEGGPEVPPTITSRRQQERARAAWHARGTRRRTTR